MKNQIRISLTYSIPDTTQIEDVLKYARATKEQNAQQPVILDKLKRIRVVIDALENIGDALSDVSPI